MLHYAALPSCTHPSSPGLVFKDLSLFCAKLLPLSRCNLCDCSHWLAFAFFLKGRAVLCQEATKRTSTWLLGSLRIFLNSATRSWPALPFFPFFPFTSSFKECLHLLFILSWLPGASPHTQERSPSPRALNFMEANLAKPPRCPLLSFCNSSRLSSTKRPKATRIGFWGSMTRMRLWKGTLRLRLVPKWFEPKCMLYRKISIYVYVSTCAPPRTIQASMWQEVYGPATQATPRCTQLRFKLSHPGLALQGSMRSSAWRKSAGNAAMTSRHLGPLDHSVVPAKPLLCEEPLMVSATFSGIQHLSHYLRAPHQMISCSKQLMPAYSPSPLCPTKNCGHFQGWVSGEPKLKMSICSLQITCSDLSKRFLPNNTCGNQRAKTPKWWWCDDFCMVNE